MKLPEYPKALWMPGLPIQEDPNKPDLNPIHVNREKEEDEKKAKGWTERCPHYEFPRGMHHATLPMARAENEEERDVLLAQGYSLKPVVGPAPEPAGPSEVDLMRQQIAEQQRQIAELEAKRGGRGKVVVGTY
jgi:hypothetical protein